MIFEKIILSLVIISSLVCFGACKEKEDPPCVAGPCEGIPDAPQGGYRTVRGTWQNVVSVAPDGSGRIVTSGTLADHPEQGTYVINLNNGAVQKLNTQVIMASNPSFGFNDEIIYSDAARVWKINADGTGETLVLDRPGSAFFYPIFDETGNRIASTRRTFTSLADSLAIYNRLTDSITLYAPLTGWVAVSPLGDKVAFAEGGTRFGYVDLNTGLKWYLPSLSFQVNTFVWDNSGENILWAGFRRFKNICGEYDSENAIFKTNIETRNTTTIVQGCENRLYQYLDIDRITGEIYSTVADILLLDELTLSIETHIWRIAPDGSTEEQVTF